MVSRNEAVVVTARNLPMRLIVVSNREPYEHRWVKGELRCDPTDGGVTSALDPILSRRGGTWVAWGSGDADREAVGAGSAIDVPPAAPAYRLRRVWLSAEEVQAGYHGYANEVLWPLCHSILDRVAYRRAYWEGYERLNSRFALAVREEWHRQPGVVWIHDFHLALMPQLIKEERPHIPVALFWHIPWPGPDTFRILPQCETILQSLLAADSLMFQTRRDVQRFSDCALQMLGAVMDSDARIVQYKGRLTRVAAHPVSVDFTRFSADAKKTAVDVSMRAIRDTLSLPPTVRIGLGVDRLDYTKGLLKRLWALDVFFTRYPEFYGRFTFVQVAIPTRTEMAAFRRYRERIRTAVADLNHRHGSPRGPSGWRPVVYAEGRIDRYQLLAYYRMADLALVTSVYDDMNLVAKEYVAAQVEERGVLLISQMAGAAAELKEALVINPYDSDGMAEAMKTALDMRPEERKDRMRRLRQHVAMHDLDVWEKSCLQDIAAW